MVNLAARGERLKEPAIKLSEIDKQLLACLGKLLLQQLDGEPEIANCPLSHSIIADDEASELLHLLELVINDQLFFAKMALIQSVASGRDEQAYRLYMDLRYGKGRKHPWVRSQWNALAEIIGTFDKGRSHKAIPFQAFLSRERFLFETLGVDRRVSQLLCRFVANREGAVRELRSNQRVWRESFNRDVFIPIRKALHEAVELSGGLIPKRRLSSLFTIISNTSVLFTTRDWDAVGFVSSIAGVYISTISAD